ncbi:MAG: 4Fe-4S dicluster domain-containing protein [Rhodospirillales bacterium]|nr:4Fe-4S dicluster domain-containing protein [Rhodospirillales bacterium]
MSSLLGNIFKGWSDYTKGNEEGGHHDYEHMYAMVIDLDMCTGCNACSTACYAENNLATVGEEYFGARQAMHWMRIERYFDEPNVGEAEADTQSRGASFLPMMCQHCNAAPCEPVCPVAATYHTPDGLNAQIYNRCIGSRYCANNCPFRVRYFNFYDHQETAWPAPMEQQLNPDISVRSKGVMEKCTFCIQRTRAARNTAKNEGRAIRDGEIQTACQQTCPTSAILFGDLLDETSAVHQAWKRHQVQLGKYAQNKTNPELRGYRIFEELNVDTKVLYLERVREV